MIMRKLTTTLAALALLGMTSTGCYSPEFSGAGGFKCNKNDSCPEGFSCAGPTGGRVCVKSGGTLPDSGSPDLGDKDAGVDTTVDGPSAKPLACVIESGGATELASQDVVGTIGFAFDKKIGVLYASYLTAKTGNRTLHVLSAKSGQKLKEELPLPLQGGGAGSSIAAGDGKWVAVYQDKVAGKEEFLAIRSTKPTISIRLAQGVVAGAFPHVALIPGQGDIVGVHQYKKDTAIGRPAGQMVRVAFGTGNVLSTYDVLAKGYTDSGRDNRIIVDTAQTPPVLVYGSIATKSNNTAVVVATGALSPSTPTETVVAVGTINAVGITGDLAGVDLAPGLHVVVARKDTTPDPIVSYRAPGKTSGVALPNLTKVGQPRIAVESGMVGVAMIDRTFKAKLTVRDENNDTWTAPLDLPDIAAAIQLVATPGGNAKEVIFHVLYRAGALGPKLLHQPVRCTRE
jgi:hypothetical protein